MDTTALLQQWNSGDESVRATLIDGVYDELRRLAAGKMRNERADHLFSPTVLVHEAYLRLINTDRIEWQNRAHFLAIAATLMREILIDHARKRNAVKRDHGYRVTLDDSMLGGTSSTPADVLDVDRALIQLNEIDARKARVAELKFFGGLTLEETAVAMECSAATVSREWQLARAWLLDALKAA